MKKVSIVWLLDLVNVASAGKVGSNLSIPTVQERKGFRSKTPTSFELSRDRDKKGLVFCEP